MTDNFIKMIAAGKLESMIKKELLCPKCKDPISPPIHHCEKGHSFCNLCSSRGMVCTFCHTQVKVDRTLHLERIVKLYTYSCKYFPKGCKTICTIDKLKSHEESCQTFEMICPLNCETQCSYVGNRLQIVFHCQLTHGYRTFVGGSFMKFQVTEDFVSQIEAVQKLSSFTRTMRTMANKFQSVYLIYADNVIFQVVCRFRAKEFKIAVFRACPPAEVNHQYEFRIALNHKCCRKPFKSLKAICGITKKDASIHDFEKYCVKISYDCFKPCSYFSMEFSRKN